MSFTNQQWLTLIVALLTLAGVAIGRVPKIHLNRASIALIGSSLLVLFGIQDIHAAWQLVDGDILVLIGSVANLIVVEIARNQGVHVSFITYLKIGVPVTLVTLVIGVVWLIGTQ